MADDATLRPQPRHGIVESEVPGNPILGAPTPRKRRPKPRTRRPAEVLTDAEVRILLAACGDDLVGIRHRALLVMMYRAGLRISEALSLRPHDVDLAASTVRVRFAKGGRDRVVGLDPGAGAVVGAWAERRATLAVPATSPLFCSRSGRALGEPDLDGLTLLAMDEFAIHKGHRYATVVIDPTCKRVLWVGKGRDRGSLRPFFEMLGPHRCAQVRAVAMDMNSAHEAEVKANCPQAQVVFDLFHVVAKYGREVIDRVRVDEANRLKGDKPSRHVVKSSRWLLLRNAENVPPRDRVRLRDLLNANKALMTVYVLRDELKHLWDFRSRGHAFRFWKQWHGHAVRSRIEPLRRFAKKLKPYLHGILSHCAFPLHTSLLEGINNKIKVIKRMAYGFRDDAYFFLKIRAAFPGSLPGNTG
ncbi:MAG: ISL3 family transposase [Phycisphaerales bacterium]|nr:ISL3 family transposase [Phycisphaerales bacterium]